MKFPITKLVCTCLHVLLLSILFTLPVTGTILVKCKEKERIALLKIKADLKANNGGSISEWGTKEDEKECCRWDGVQCDEKTNHVVGLNISTPSASGKINPFLRDLVHLKYLTLHGIDFNGSPIPEFMGSLGKLQYLSIPDSNLGGLIPHHLGNLSLLRHLDLSGNSLSNITDLDWLFSLHLLEYLDLSYVDLSSATAWMQVIINLPSLYHLNLQSCRLSATLPPGFKLPLINTSTSLSFIDLSLNSLSTTSILAQFLNVSRSFIYIDFVGNQMMGKVPDALGNLTFLSHVDLSHNRLEGGVPTALWNCTMLRYLNLGENLLHDSLPNMLKLQNLETLDLHGNGFVGSISDLSWCTSLRMVHFYQNVFNGTLSKSIGSLSKLEVLHLGSNNLEGEINEVHLFNLSQLEILDLSSNPNLRVMIDRHSNPPFKLDMIILSHCDLYQISQSGF